MNKVKRKVAKGDVNKGKKVVVNKVKKWAKVAVNKVKRGKNKVAKIAVSIKKL